MAVIKLDVSEVTRAALIAAQDATRAAGGDVRALQDKLMRDGLMCHSGPVQAAAKRKPARKAKAKKAA